MLPAAPFYCGLAAPTPWAALPDVAGDPPSISPHSTANADVDYTLGEVLPPACPTQPNLAAARWGPGGPHVFPNVDPEDPTA